MDARGFSLLLQGTGEIAAAALLVDSQWLAAETNLGAIQLFELRLVDTLAMEQDWSAEVGSPSVQAFQCMLRPVVIARRPPVLSRHDHF